MGRVRTRALTAAVLTALVASLTALAVPASSVESVEPAVDGAEVAGFVVTTTASDATLAKATDRALDESGVAGVREGVDGTSVVRLTDAVSAADADAAATVLEERRDVLSVAPDYVFGTADAAPVDLGDPRYPEQWHLWDTRYPGGGYSTRAPAYWAATGTYGAGVTVAVLDTGTTAHEDLLPQLSGFDFVEGDVDTTDSSRCTGQFHGTHVAGIIGARDNAVGVVGVAPGVNLLPARVLECGSGLSSDLAAAIYWAAGHEVTGVTPNENQADVINLSLAGPGQCSQLPYLQEAIDYATSVGVLVVVAAGNDAASASGYFPANCANVVAVGATDAAGNPASFTNYGPSVDVSAPGVGILSTYSTSAYASLSGTSMAAPAVSGAAALLLADGVPAADVAEVLRGSVQPFAPGSACTWRGCGTGILDLAHVAAAGPRTFTATTLSPPTSVVHGTSFAMPVTVTSSAGSATGAVEVYSDGVLVGTGGVSSGSGSVVVRSLSVGAHGLTARFVGGGAVLGSTSELVVIAVAKAASRNTISVPAKVKKSKQAKVRVWIRANGIASPTGLLHVYDGRKLIVTARLDASQRGNRVVTLPKLKKAGNHSIKVVYTGNGSVTGKTSVTKKLKVTR